MSDELIVFDAGRGLLVLGQAMVTQRRFRRVRKIHVLVTHAHFDHWEGLKDVNWFWRPENGLEVTIYGNRQTLGTIRRGFAHPSYVPLDILAMGTVAELKFVSIRSRMRRAVAGGILETFPLHHYSGEGASKRFLDTLGYRFARDDGPRVGYVSDHEPTAETVTLEDEVVSGVDLVVYDAHFGTIREQRYGHGSQEHAARLARRHRGTSMLASHLGPMYTDRELAAIAKRYGGSLTNYAIAREGQTYRWSPRTRRFARTRGR